MISFIYLFPFLLGLVLVAVGIISWIWADAQGNFFSPLSILWLLAGALTIFFNFDSLFSYLRIPATVYREKNTTLMKSNPALQKVYIVGLIYIGTLFYTLASYYHLKETQWSFLKSWLIAIPFVLIEYQFSLRGNYLANTVLDFNAIQITLITIICAFINSSLLTYFVLKEKVVMWREALAFFLIACSYGVINYRA